MGVGPENGIRLWPTQWDVTAIYRQIVDISKTKLFSLRTFLSARAPMNFEALNSNTSRKHDVDAPEYLEGRLPKTVETHHRRTPVCAFFAHTAASAFPCFRAGSGWPLNRVEQVLLPGHCRRLDALAKAKLPRAPECNTGLS